MINSIYVDNIIKTALLEDIKVLDEALATRVLSERTGSTFSALRPFGSKLP